MEEEQAEDDFGTILTRLIFSFTLFTILINLSDMLKLHFQDRVGIFQKAFAIFDARDSITMLEKFLQYFNKII